MRFSGIVLGMFLIAFLAGLPAQSYAGSAVDDLLASQKVIRVYFPDPFEAELALLAHWEDRLVFLHRAMFQAETSSGLGGALASYLKKALVDLHKVTSAATKAWMSGNQERIDRVKEYASGLKIEGDRAAFAQMFSILSPADRAKFRDLAEECKKLATGLADAATLKSYLAAIAKDPDFAKHSPIATAWRKIKDDFRRLAAGISEKFAIERVLRFVEKARKAAGTGPLANALSQLGLRLRTNLVERINEELTGQVENDLCAKTITKLALVDNGGSQGFMIKESLLRGRLHTITALCVRGDQLDRDLFRPLLGRNILETVNKLKAKASKPDQQEYLTKVAQTIEDVVRYAARPVPTDQETQAPSNDDKVEQKAIRAWLCEEDKAGLFPGLDALTLP